MKNRLWVLAVNDSNFTSNEEEVKANPDSDRSFVLSSVPFFGVGYKDDKGKGLFLKETTQVTVEGEEFEVGQWINRREDQETNDNYCYIVLSVGVYSVKSDIFHGFIF
jgi:hypothetical protein